jgi:hypothetical protein
MEFAEGKMQRECSEKNLYESAKPDTVKDECYIIY